MMQRPSGSQDLNRWQRVLTFDDNVLQEIYRDTTATVPAVLTVLAVMILSGVGGFVWWAVIENNPQQTDFLLESTVIGTLIATGMFFVWVGLVAAMAGQLGRPGNIGQGSQPGNISQFGRQGNQELSATVRTLSFASVPFGLSALVFIPGLEFVISIVALSLLFISTTLATRIALNVTFARALGSNLTGFFLWLIILSTLMDAPNNYFAPAIFFWGAFA
ncbi:MAG TPA: hypothetical protein QGF05_06440 [Dehalococcoidia bacterium]|nr:hypothetical protein [Dehalococcoidia bacterium]